MMSVSVKSNVGALHPGLHHMRHGMGKQATVLQTSCLPAPSVKGPTYRNVIG